MAPIDDYAIHMKAIAALEDVDRLLAHKDAVQLGEDQVYTMDQVTPHWLTTVLGNKVPGAVVVSTKIAGGHEGMTSRHKWDLEWNKEGKDAGLPTRVFFKSTPTNSHLLEMLSLLHMDEREVNVFNVLGDELSDLIPKCYYAKSYPGGRHIIILEDLEERGITPHWMADTLTIPFARAVAVAFAKLHSRYWNSERFGTDMIFLRPKSRRFGERWQTEFFEDNRRKFLELDIGKNVSPYMKELIQLWNKSYNTVNEYFDRKAPTIIHGDSHLGNVLEFPDGSAGMYDWQCCFRGYGPRDLAYFLMSSMTQEDAEAHEREIFDLYADTLQKHGVKVDREELWQDYCLLALDRLDSAMTSLTNGGYGHGISAFVRQVRTISWCAKEHDVLNILKRVVGEKPTTNGHA